ncbi:CocE/NonD family hydrolase [Aquimarina sp. AU474]|uniref:CocE/NonD family hydrolase n=1 Tax=Aquimarina sp. AU474 TaxID=2108529 RepID=UPI000D69A6DA|nr:CocE/NonD family hydrolase [Aquimarina sp. AU474]
MKKIIWILFFGLSFTNLFSQEYYLSKEIKNNSSLLSKEITKISKEILDDYSEKKREIYHKNRITLQILSQKYTEALESIDSLRIISGKEYPEESALISIENYMYAKARTIKDKTFEKAYTLVFKSVYDSLTDKTKLRVPIRFDKTIASQNRKIKKLLDSKKEEDSVSQRDFFTLSSLELSATVIKETKSIAIELLKQEDQKRYITRDSVSIKTKDGATIALRIGQKKGDSKPKPTMLIFSIYPYKSGVVDDFLVKEAAYYGYVGVIANTRGKRFSPETIEPFEHDANDAYEVIDWISKQPWSNGEVGMMGGSYLGFSQWAAAKGLHPALKTIVPQVSVGIGNDYPMENNVFMSYMIRWINFVTAHDFIDLENFLDSKRWNKLYRKWYTSGKSFRALDSLDGSPNKIFQRWLDHPSYDQYWRNMTPNKEEFSKINIPVLSTTGYFDSDQVGALHYYNEHTKHNKNANHYLVIGPYNHPSAAGRTAQKVGKYTVDSVSKMDMDVLAYQWFDYIFKGAKKPDILKDKVNYQVMEANIWKHKPSLKAMNNDTLVFYLKNVLKQNQYELTLQKPNEKEIITQEIDFLYRGDSLQKSNSFFQKKLQIHNKLSFVSEPLTESFDINGRFLADIYIEINKKDMDVEIEIFEMKEDSSYIRLSNYLGRASYAKDPSTRNLLKAGKREYIPVKNSLFMSKRIQKGSRLVVLLGIHKSPRWQINYGTGKNVSDETIADGKIPLRIKWFCNSAIKIPINKIKE